MSRSLRRAFIAIGFFFICLFAAGGYTIALAVKHSEPILDERYYEKGLDYQPRLDQLKLAKEEGWNYRTELLTARNVQVNEKEYSIAIQIPEGHSIETAKLQIRIDRPASTRFTVEKTLTEQDAKIAGNEMIFKTDWKMPALGYVDIHLESSINDRVVLYERHRVFSEK